MPRSAIRRRVSARCADPAHIERLEARVLLATFAYTELPLLEGSELRLTGVSDESQLWGEYDGGFFFMDGPHATPVNQSDFVPLLEAGERIIDVDDALFFGVPQPGQPDYEWHVLVADDDAGTNPALISFGSGQTPRRVELTGLSEAGAPAGSTFGAPLGIAANDRAEVVVQRQRTGPDGTFASTWIFQQGTLYYVGDGVPIGINDADTIVANGPDGRAWTWSSGVGVVDLGEFVATGFSDTQDHALGGSYVFGTHPDTPGQVWLAIRPTTYPPGQGPPGSPTMPGPVRLYNIGGPAGAVQVNPTSWNVSLVGSWVDGHGRLRGFTTGFIDFSTGMPQGGFSDINGTIVNAPPEFESGSVEFLWQEFGTVTHGTYPNQTHVSENRFYIGRHGPGGAGFLLQAVDDGLVYLSDFVTHTNHNNSAPDRVLDFTVLSVPLGIEYRIVMYDDQGDAVLTIPGVSDGELHRVLSAGDQPLPDGVYTFHLQVLVDGELMHTTETREAVIDTVAPVFTSTAPTSMPVTFRYDPQTADEGTEFGVLAYEWQFHGPATPSAGLPWGGGAEMVVAPPASVLGVPIEATVIAIDRAGNRSEQTFTFTVTGEALFFPEGFTGETIDEFLAIANSNSQAVQYRVNVYYEAVGWSATIAEGTIAAHSRGGVTVSTRETWDSALVVPGQPYSFEVIAEAPIAVSLSHYDFGGATSETFTDRTSHEWMIPAGRVEANVRDFILWHNPNLAGGFVSTHFYADDGTFLLTHTVSISEGLRGGLDVTGLGLPTGRYTARIVATVPIVASLTQYLTEDHVNGPAAFMSLGVADGGATAAALPLLLADHTSVLQIHNPGAGEARIDFTFTSGSGAVVTHTLALTAGRTTTFVPSLVDGMVLGDRYAVSYQSNVPVAVVAVQREHGDLVATALADVASTSTGFFFADGFMNPDRAGVDVFETVSIYNPSAADAVEATITLRFTDGFELAMTVRVEAGRSVHVDLHEWEALLEQGRDFERFFYSVQVEAEAPVIAGMWHFDLTLGGDTPAGGFAVLGAPFESGATAS